MATYNGGKVVQRQIKSIIDQLSPDDEVLIVDDASTDDTVTKIKSLNDNRIKICINKSTLGPIGSFERALSMVNGDIIFLSDQDDIWLSNKVGTALADFKKKKCQVWTHDSEVVDVNLKRISNSWNTYNHNRFTGSNFGTLIKNPFTGSMMAFTRQALSASLPFPKNIIMHDQWIGMVAQKRKLEIYHSDKILMKYIRYGNNVTAKRKKNILHMIMARYRMIGNIINYSK